MKEIFMCVQKKMKGTLRNNSMAIIDIARIPSMINLIILLDLLKVFVISSNICKPLSEYQGSETLTETLTLTLEA